ncbi:MAG: hypothetical protein EKK47_20420 [Burkholderiales bacterium]|nr:MAG: hypothetical protein EKK47_20420 [Burkholderiales bacterium]
MTTITIPVGATVRVRRQNGTVDTYLFRGTDAGGLLFEDPAGKVHRDVGVYTGIAVDLPGHEA